ncbi:Uncharacterised protein [Clostridioides difficile]|nr:Uncharacterised protein [Clostridioides difficile]
MSELMVRAILGDEFEYGVIMNKFKEDEIANYQKWIYRRFHSLCNKKMNNELNSEWTVRHYLAAKMILSATVMISSLEYCIEKNVKMSIPYLSYYAILTCCRAVIFTMPDIKWKNDSFLQMTHTKIINEVKDCIMKLNQDYAEKLYKDINLYKEYREIFSYRFPASGLDEPLAKECPITKTVCICTLLCDIAQLNSSEIEKYIFKNCLEDLNDWYKLDVEYLKHCFCYKLGDDIKIIDKEDGYRIDYINRKKPFPVSIYNTMSEGMVEDFFGSWYSSEIDKDDTIYNPDIDWRLIFNVP